MGLVGALPSAKQRGESSPALSLSGLGKGDQNSGTFSCPSLFPPPAAIGRVDQIRVGLYPGLMTGLKPSGERCHAPGSFKAPGPTGPELPPCA